MQTQAMTNGLNAPGITELAPAPFQSVLDQIEAELCSSALYEQAAYTLRKMPVELGKQLQLMLKAVGREAIRLSLRKLLKAELAELSELNDEPVAQSGRSHLAECTLAAAAPQAKLHANAPNATILPVETILPIETDCINSIGPEVESPAWVQSDTTLAASLESAGLAVTDALVANPFTDTDFTVPSADPELSPEAPSVPPSTLLPQAVLSNQSQISLWRRLMELHQADQIAQAMAQAWEDRLKAIGQEIRQRREAQALSIAQVHQTTFIPEHILTAIEQGDIDHLPEDVYIRGFLRHIGPAIGVDGVELANSLPSPLRDPNQAVLPTWQHKIWQTKSGVAPVYLYVGYATLLAAGLGWVSQQMTTKVNVVPFVPTAPSVEQPGGDRSSQGQVPQRYGQAHPGTIARVSQPESFRSAIAVP